MTLVAPTLQAFFSDRLTRQLHASPRTIACYAGFVSAALNFIRCLLDRLRAMCSSG
jgi:hypothetical protein